jgi:hypothetical protein
VGEKVLNSIFIQILEGNMSKGALVVKKNPINTPPYIDVPDVALSALSALLINGYIYSIKEEKKYLTMNRPGLLYPAFCDLNLAYGIDGLWWWPAKKVVLATCNGLVFSINQAGTATQLTGVTLTPGTTSFTQGGNAGTVAFMASGGPLVYTDDLVTLKNPQGLGVPTAATDVCYMDDHFIANEAGTAKFKFTNPGVYTADIVTGTDGKSYMTYLNHIAVDTSSLAMNFINGNSDPTGLQIQSYDGSAIAVVRSATIDTGTFALGTAAGKLSLSTWNAGVFPIGPGTFLYTSITGNITSMAFINGNHDPTGKIIKNEITGAAATVTSVTISSGSFAGSNCAGTLNLVRWNGINFEIGAGTFLYTSLVPGFTMSFINGTVDPTGLTICNLDNTALGFVSSVSIASGSFSAGNAAGTLTLTTWNGVGFDIGLGTLLYCLPNPSHPQIALLQPLPFAEGTTQPAAIAGGVTWNSSDQNPYVILSTDELTATGAAGNYGNGYGSVRATAGSSTEKKYGEVKVRALVTHGQNDIYIGIATSAATEASNSPFGTDTHGWAYTNGSDYALTGVIANNSTPTVYGENFTIGDTISVLWDAVVGTLEFWKNGIPQGIAFTGLSGTMFPAVSIMAGEVEANFGAVPFAYTPPAGFSGWDSLSVAEATAQPVSATGSVLEEIAQATTSPVNVNSNQPITGNAWTAYWQLTTAAANKTWTAGVSYDAGWPALNFGSMEAKGDVLQAIDTRFDMIVLFGNNSIEYWFNDGVSPFSKYEGLTSETGTIAPSSVLFDGNLHWMIDSDRNLVQLVNRAPKVISNPFASILQSMGVIEDASLFGVKCDGRNFVIMSFPTANITLAYDAEGEMWQGQWGTWNTDTASFDQWIAGCSCKCPDWGFDLAGDRRSGKIYKISKNYNTDAESILRMVKRTGMIDYGIKYKKRSNRIRITIQRGIGLSTSVEPVFTVKTAIDGGTFGDERTGSLGLVGDTYSFVEFRQNGIFRYKQDEYSFSDAVPVIIIDCEEELEVLSQ